MPQGTRGRFASPARRAAVATLALLGAVGACSVKKNVWLAGLPGLETSFHVESATPRDGYLDVRLQGDDFGLRTFLPADATCAAVVEQGEAVRFVPDGPYGGLARGDRECQSVGIGSLAEWRARRPETQGLRSTPVPSAQASYRIVYRDEDVVLAHGRFPLAAKLGWLGLADTIAVLPNTDPCQRAIASGVSTMEYFPTGSRVLTLVSGNGRCDIQGLLLPLPASQAGPPAR